MLEAFPVWRLFPTQIESDLALHYGRSIGEWHSGSMSSRELLVLLEGLPESSKFKGSLERSVRVVRYTGDDPELKGKLLKMTGIGPPASDVEVLAEFIDWTHERKMQARLVREIASLRPEPDYTGAMEPLHTVLSQIHAQEMQQLDDQFDKQIYAGLHGHERS